MEGVWEAGMSDTDLAASLRQIATWVVGSAPQATLRAAADRLERLEAELRAVQAEEGRWRELSRVQEVALEGLRSDLAAVTSERDRLEAAIREHHAQKADDRCWLDDVKLYAAAGLPPADVTIESPSAMLSNCERYIELRMCGKEGAWKSYAELEADLAATRGLLRRLCEAGGGLAGSLAWLEPTHPRDEKLEAFEAVRRALVPFRKAAAAARASLEGTADEVHR